MSLLAEAASCALTLAFFFGPVIYLKRREIAAFLAECLWEDA